MATAETAAPRPKSPPASPDPCGRHRLQLAVDALHREIGFLEGEISSIEGVHAASRCCKEVDEFVGKNPDPFIKIQSGKRSNDQSQQYMKKSREELPELPVVDLLLRRVLAVPAQEADELLLVLLRAAAAEAVRLLLLLRLLPVPRRVRGRRRLLLHGAVPAVLVRLHLLLPQLLLRLLPLPQLRLHPRVVLLRPELLSVLLIDDDDHPPDGEIFARVLMLP
ncbi:hypothetical protein ACP70R_012233 [Stipagrostis hirtigluma subsp. patula]